MDETAVGNDDGAGRDGVSEFQFLARGCAGDESYHVGGYLVEREKLENFVDEVNEKNKILSFISEYDPLTE